MQPTAEEVQMPFCNKDLQKLLAAMSYLVHIGRVHRAFPLIHALATFCYRCRSRFLGLRVYSQAEVCRVLRLTLRRSLHPLCWAIFSSNTFGDSVFDADSCQLLNSLAGGCLAPNCMHSGFNNLFVLPLCSRITLLQNPAIVIPCYYIHNIPYTSCHLKFVDR